MYHIIPGSVNMSRLKDEDTIPTVSGKDIRFNKYQSKEGEESNQGGQVGRNRGQSDRHQKSNSSISTLLTLSGAPVVGMSEIEEGRIQFVIVDRVMYPPQGNLFQIISKSPILRSLTNLVNVANLQTELSVSGPFTLFAPSDQAFNKLTPESIGYLSHDAESSRGMSSWYLEVTFFFRFLGRSLSFFVFTEVIFDTFFRWRSFLILSFAGGRFEFLSTIGCYFR